MLLKVLADTALSSVDETHCAVPHPEAAGWIASVLSRIVLEFGDVSPGMMRLARQAARATV
jgi:hypothetical protein